MKHVMLGDRVLIEPITENVSSGGIYIPDSTKEKPMRGKVILAGPKAESVKGGDEVLYGKYAGIEAPLDGKEYLIMKEEDLLMILKK